MITTWLWSTDGPRRYQGVSGTHQDAQAACEELLNSSAGGSSACVEMARLILGAQRSYYQLSGYGWTARAGSGEIDWTPFEVIRDRTAC